MSGTVYVRLSVCRNERLGFIGYSTSSEALWSFPVGGDRVTALTIPQMPSKQEHSVVHARAYTEVEEKSSSRDRERKGEPGVGKGGMVRRTPPKEMTVKAFQRQD